jgi:hypothetical protein
MVLMDQVHGDVGDPSAIALAKEDPGVLGVSSPTSSAALEAKENMYAANWKRKTVDG